MLVDSIVGPTPAISPVAMPDHAPGDPLDPAVPDQAATAEIDLAAELVAVLSRKPRRRPQPVMRHGSAPPDEIEFGGSDIETATVHTANRRALASALRNQASSLEIPVDVPDDRDDETDDGATAPIRLSSWLAAARNRSMRRSLNAAGAWIATIAIGTAVVAIAAIMLFEGPRDLGAWLDFAYRTL